MRRAEHFARNTARVRDDVFDEVRRHFDEAEIAALHPTARLDPARSKSYLMDIVENWPREFPEPR